MQQPNYRENNSNMIKNGASFEIYVVVCSNIAKLI